MGDLSSVKAGDKVLATWGYGGLRVMVVEKVTKLHAILPGGTKYRLRDGWRVGAGAWSHDYINPFDEKEWRDYRQEQADKNVLRALHDFNWLKLDMETARKIHAMLPAPPEPIAGE